jgi:FkbM family methyltransferase
MKDSYAQLGEDLVVDHYLGEPEKGVYLDIGAYEPIFLSNTYKFYRRGWKGILVEPNALKIEKFRADRPNDTLFTEACGEPDLKFMVDPRHDSLSSCSKGEGVPIKSRPLKEYLGMLPQVDLLSVDTEGMELDVLKSNDWSIWRPKCVIVEVIDYVTKMKNHAVFNFMKEQGYGLVCDNQINAIFLEEKLYNPIFLTTLRP